MSPTVTGMAGGAVLAAVALASGFWGFLLTALFMGFGAVLGRTAEGRLDLGPIPDNVDVRAFFPQLDVLGHADVFLSHTGMNSTMEALYFGVPLVAFPLQPEQEANARRVEELGLGRRLPADSFSPALIRTVITEVSDDQEIRRNVRAMKQRIRGSGGPAAAADAIESYLSALEHPA